MLRKSTMVAVFKEIALITSIYINAKANDSITNGVIFLLAFTCVFIVEYLIQNMILRKKVGVLFCFAQLIGLFVLNENAFIPLVMITIIQLFDEVENEKYFYLLNGTMGGLLLIVLSPGQEELFFSFVLVVPFLYMRKIRGKGSKYRLLVMEQKEEIAELKQKIADNKRLVKTLQYTAAVEERNRLATRLHDKIGHGISGSIILLEAAMLMFERNPQKAKQGIDKAVNNLREGVDDIRDALREERPVRSTLGMNDLKATLDKVQANHGIQTRLTTKGNIDCISVARFGCIHENLEEALTNLLKHSNASEFTLDIVIQNKVIKVIYKDNGRTEQRFEKGMGLEAIEERTIKSGGRCFFDMSETGFVITNVFVF